jgi:drug/metabolite transporter (DMT)-like permease
MLGIILAITAAFCWGAGAIFARLGMQGMRASTGTFISMLSSIALIAVLALSLNFDAIVNLSLMAVLWFSLIGFVNYFVGRQFNYLSIKYIGVARATPLFAAAPLFALVLAVTLIGETVNAAIIIGTLAVVSGLYLVITSE